MVNTTDITRTTDISVYKTLKYIKNVVTLKYYLYHNLLYYIETYTYLLIFL